jgi:molybdenum cofactor sulfurtransferase
MQNVTASRFRANFVLQTPTNFPAFAEDHWKHLQLGAYRFNVVGPCFRCSMVNIDQASGKRDIKLLPVISQMHQVHNQPAFGILLKLEATAEPRSDGHSISVRVAPQILVSYPALRWLHEGDSTTAICHMNPI